jgi:methylenetetrahydrofolate--tRNA-(uracil-5-)-methyltransferase
MKKAIVIGGGMAGCEAAQIIASYGIDVDLYEQKPVNFSPAHKKEGLAELVCSNSLKASRLASASGLLKEEMRLLGSLLVPCAEATAVAAGGALAVDRDLFSAAVTEAITHNPRIHLHREEVTTLSFDCPAVVATGPLTSDGMAEQIRTLTGEASLSFFDAAAPIVSADSIDREIVFAASRYDRGGEDDYLNCPMNKEEYAAFYEALIHAEGAPRHDFDGDPKKLKVYEGCMPIEIMARRGDDTIRFGPLKPVGLRDPRTGHRPWAVVQLRKENEAGTMYNLVGFQTNLKWGEQKRVFSMIPGLGNAEFVRYGVMHRNTFLNAPQLLGRDFHLLKDENLYFAGQMTGVEGYMESAASGLIAGHALARKMLGLSPIELPHETMTGALCDHVVDRTTSDYQPMGSNMGILPPLPNRIRDKKERYQQVAERAIAALQAELEKVGYSADRSV